MKRGTTDHPKLHDLCGRLGLERWGGVGVLESVWHFTARYSPRGDVGRFGEGAIARGLEWRGDPLNLIEALVASGWLDRCSCHRIRVHDWPDHADQTVKRSAEVEKLGFLKCYGDASKLLENSSGQLANDEKKLASGAFPEPEPFLAGAGHSDTGASTPAPAKSGRSRALTDPPEGLEAEEIFAALSVWALDEPDMAEYSTLAEIDADQPKLRRVLAQCFDHFRANGKRKRSWEATARNWLRREKGIAAARASARAGDEALAHRARMRAIEGVARTR